MAFPIHLFCVQGLSLWLDAKIVGPRTQIADSSFARVIPVATASFDATNANSDT